MVKTKNLCETDACFKAELEKLIARHSGGPGVVSEAAPSLKAGYSTPKRERVVFKREDEEMGLVFALNDTRGQKVDALLLTPSSMDKKDIIYLISTKRQTFKKVDLESKQRDRDFYVALVNEKYEELKHLVENDEMRYVGLSGQDPEEESTQNSDARAYQHASGIAVASWRRIYRGLGEFVEKYGNTPVMQELVENVFLPDLSFLESLFIEKFRAASGKGLNSTASEEAFTELNGGSKKRRLDLSDNALEQIEKAGQEKLRLKAEKLAQQDKENQEPKTIASGSKRKRKWRY